MNSIRANNSIRPLTVFLIILAATLCACSSGVNLRPGDINSLEDSIIVGRMRFIPGASCVRPAQIPAFELRNADKRTSTPFGSPGWTSPQEGQIIDIPISRKVEPGTYELRIQVEKGTWDSVWLDEDQLPLARFEVPRGLLVYFGTIEVALKCEGSTRNGRAQYSDHTVMDESALDIGLFQKEHSEVYQMYQNKILLQVKQAPWKEL